MTHSSNQVITLTCIPPDRPIYPNSIKDFWQQADSPALSTIGNVKILQHHRGAISCFIKCPGDFMFKTYDLAQSCRDAGVTVISSFHSPTEKNISDFCCEELSLSSLILLVA